MLLQGLQQQPLALQHLQLLSLLLLPVLPALQLQLLLPVQPVQPVPQQLLLPYHSLLRVLLLPAHPLAAADPDSGWAAAPAALHWQYQVHLPPCLPAAPLAAASARYCAHCR
jgi:hypothetical protein